MATNPATTYWRNLLESEGIEFTYWRDRLAAAVSALAQFDLLDIYHAPPGRAEEPGGAGEAMSHDRQSGTDQPAWRRCHHPRRRATAALQSLPRPDRAPAP